MGRACSKNMDKKKSYRLLGGEARRKNNKENQDVGG
jgi:hypothetical protein